MVCLTHSVHWHQLAWAHHNTRNTQKKWTKISKKWDNSVWNCLRRGVKTKDWGGMWREGSRDWHCLPPAPLPPPPPPSQLSLRAFNIISVGRSVQQMKKQKLDPTLKNFQVLMQKMCKNKNNPEETQQLYIQWVTWRCLVWIGAFTLRGQSLSVSVRVSARWLPSWSWLPMKN